MLKNYLNSILWFMGILIIGTIFITIFNYFEILNTNIIKILKMVLIIFDTFIASFKLGKKCKKNGYIEGLKFGGIILTILIIMNLIFNSLSWKQIIIFTIILATSMLGGMIGITRKKEI